MTICPRGRNLADGPSRLTLYHAVRSANPWQRAFDRSTCAVRNVPSVNCCKDLRPCPAVPSLRRRIDDNLRLIYPDMTDTRRVEILRANAANVGRGFLDVRHADRIMAAAERGEIPITGDEGFEALKAAKAAGRGAILVSGHYGQWDAGRAALRMHDMEISGVYREHNNRYFQKDLLKTFEACGAPVFAKGPSGMRGLIKHLSKGGFAAIMMDQRTSEGEWFDFMGQPALTAPGIASLALKFDLLYMPVYGVRNADGIGYHVVMEPPIPHTDARQMTQAANDSLAARIHQDPTQWYWLHRRWAKGLRKGAESEDV